MNRYIFSLLMLLTALAAQAQQRYRVSLNSDWRFLRRDTAGAGQSVFNDDSWQRVSLPHTYNRDDAWDGTRGYYMGPAWYRRQLRTPVGTGKKRWFLYFEGANHTASVYVNGRNMGTHVGGYTSFCFDVTEVIRGEGQPNSLAVLVDNSNARKVAPISADFTFYGGLYRDVWLVGTEDIHFDPCLHAGPGVTITYPQVTEAQGTVRASMRIQNSTATRQKLVVRAELRDHNDHTVATVTDKQKLEPNQLLADRVLDVKLAKPRLWSPDSPYLYKLVTQLVDEKTKAVYDELSQPVGFRYYRFSADSGFFLNGKPLKLMGSCRHQDYAGLGNALDDERHRQDMVALKRMGGNFIRIAHYPQDHALLQACDQLGLVVWEEIPVVNEVDGSAEFTASSVSQLKDMIAQHRNHPSVVLWGYMNEVFLGLKNYGTKQDDQKRDVLKLAKLLDSTARATDPARYTVMALHNSDVYNTSGVADVPQVIGWNLYHGWYHDKFPDFGKMMDAEKKKYPKRPLIISEFGAGSDGRIHARRPERYDFSTEWARLYHESYLQQIMERPYIAGGAMWNLVDFGSEGRKETMPRINNKGLLTIDRREKDVYHLYRAWFSPKPMVYWATREWPVRKIRAGRVMPFYRDSLTVYTNCAKVNLYVNDKLMPAVTVQNHIAGYDLPLRPGVNKLVAVGLNEKGTRVATDEFDLTLIVERAILSDTTLPLGPIALNCGSNVTYNDPVNNLIYEPDQAYTPGGFGYVGGRPYYRWNRRGSQEEITPERELPVFQTWIDSLQAYQFDLPRGEYEVELLFAEADSRNKAIVNDIGTAPAGNAATNREREFDVLVQGQPVITGLNLVRDHGYNTSVRYRTIATVRDEKGLTVTFKPVKGNPCVNGIVVRKID